MAWAPIALVAASALASAYASYQSGRAQQDAANFNSAMANQQAKQARDVAKIKEENYREQVRRHMATMRAQYSASGVTMEGTPLMVMMDSAREAERDAQRIRYGGELESWAYEGESGLQKMIGKQAYKAGMVGAGTSLLSGASRAYGMYYGGTLKP